ncbi:hemin uptake protein HemP [Paroceanicella profunda]|uniref:Hemin uptake protein HemP n=1 Tax=Paroceanicella profunda TaxID=2579971 RepID=A0A5B8FHE2_9RHOB|nr:hemin uptake protein HemP [Paroceanicella profunda]QDL91898.1 hemin uptake protein HemP [Paroceanicella profunda]
MTDDPRPADLPAAPEVSEDPLRVFDTAPRHEVRDLTAGGSEAVILLDGKSYLLRITRQGKLILTK